MAFVGGHDTGCCWGGGGGVKTVELISKMLLDHIYLKVCPWTSARWRWIQLTSHKCRICKLFTAYLPLSKNQGQFHCKFQASSYMNIFTSILSPWKTKSTSSGARLGNNRMSICFKSMTITQRWTTSILMFVFDLKNKDRWSLNLVYLWLSSFIMLLSVPLPFQYIPTWIVLNEYQLEVWDV